MLGRRALLLLVILLALPPWAAAQDSDPAYSIASISGPSQSERVDGVYRIVVGPSTTIILHGSTESGAQPELDYAFDDAPYARYDAPLHVPGPTGVHTLRYYAQSATSTETPHVRALRLDATPPTVAIDTPRPRTTYLSDTTSSDDDGTHVRLSAASLDAPIAIQHEDDARPIVYNCISVNGTAIDDEGGLGDVRLYEDGAEIGFDRRASYAFTYCPREDGEHELRVVATDTMTNAGSATIRILAKRELGTTCPGDDNGFALLGECHAGPLNPLFPDGCQTIGDAQACKREQRGAECDGSTSLGAGLAGTHATLEGRGSCGNQALTAGSDAARVYVDACRLQAESAARDDEVDSCLLIFALFAPVPWGSLLP